ncbi:MAG: 2-dehydropantoate 2-reductase [Chlorobi bacterium]|nr:2-dehydropantoate 2-reductase [Chlorobiota bacterium]
MTDTNNNNNNNKLRVGVVGMGPVGCILATYLIKAGVFTVVCDVRDNIIDRIKKSGIRLTNVFTEKVKVPDAVYSIQELEMYELDLVIISTKTPSLQKVVDRLAEIDNGKMFILIAQNGIDNEQLAARRFGEERTLRMVVNFAGNLRDDHVVHVSFFNPPNYIAALLRHGEHIASELVALFNAVGLESETPPDIQDYVWEKAILNAALSPVCAITRRTMKDVLDFPQGQEFVEAIIDESVRIAEAEGIELGKKFRRFCIRYLKNAGHHRPSMLVDMEAGLPTEINYLNGRIVEYGKKHHIPAPLNMSVSQIVRMLEKDQV